MRVGESTDETEEIEIKKGLDGLRSHYLAKGQDVTGVMSVGVKV